MNILRRIHKFITNKITGDGSDEIVSRWYDGNGDEIIQIKTNGKIGRDINNNGTLNSHLHIKDDRDVNIVAEYSLNFWGRGVNIFTFGRFNTPDYYISPLSKEPAGAVKDSWLLTEKISGYCYQATNPNLILQGGNIRKLGNTNGGDIYLKGGIGQGYGTGSNGEGGNVYIDGGRGITVSGDAIDGKIIALSNYGELFDIRKTTKTQGRKFTLLDKTADYIVTTSDQKITADTNGNDIVIELLAINSDNHGQNFKIQKTDAANKCYVASFNESEFDVDTITNTAGSTWRYTLKGTFDITDTSLVAVGKLIKVNSATNAANDGYFVITGTDNSTYIEVDNASGVAEGSDSPAKLQIISYQKDLSSLGDKVDCDCDNNNNTYTEW